MCDEVIKLMKGSILKCSVCGRTIPLKNEQISKYLSNGWIKCCGYTMTLITKKEQEEND